MAFRLQVDYFVFTSCLTCDYESMKCLLIYFLGDLSHSVIELEESNLCVTHYISQLIDSKSRSRKSEASH
jgi:hypothetical protein